MYILLTKKNFSFDYIIIAEKPCPNYIIEFPWKKCALRHFKKNDAIDLTNFFFAPRTDTGTYWKKIRTTKQQQTSQEVMSTIAESFIHESRGPGKSRLPLLRPKCRPLMTPPKARYYKVAGSMRLGGGRMGLNCTQFFFKLLIFEFY